jgi:hypothetical protein
MAQDFLWVDLAVQAVEMARNGDLTSRLTRRRWQRIKQQIDVDAIDADDWEHLRRFGEAVGAWARVNKPDLTVYLPTQTLDRLAGLTFPFPDGDPAVYAALMINQYLVQAEPKLLAQAHGGRVMIGITDYGLHAVTTKPWIEYTQNPQRAQECGHCARLFKPSRKTAEYCSPSCRITALKARQKAVGAS